MTSNDNENISLKKSSDTQLRDLRAERDRHRKYKDGNAALVTAGILLLIAYLFSIMLFVVPSETNRNLAVLFSMQGQKIQSFFAWLGGNNGTAFRAPVVRYTIIVLSGAALASSGAVFQGGFRNIIASPTTMGVQAGASLGNALFLLLFTTAASSTYIVDTDMEQVRQMSVWKMNMQQLFAIVGSFIAIFAVVKIASFLGKDKLSGSTILFSGIIFSAFIGAITTIIEYWFMYHDPNNSRWQALREFGLGNYDRVMTIDHLILMSIFLVPCLIALIVISPRINVLVMGEDEARTMGINVKFYKNLIVAIGTLMAAVVFAFCGQIGFVGFIVPQICRRLVGPNFKKLIPMTMIVGGILMILVYNFAFALGFSQYMNMVTSVLGCAMMAWSFIRGKRGRSYD